MARYSEFDTTVVYEAAEQFRENCLRRDGSLMFKDVEVWSAGNLSKLHQCFVASPDSSKRSFTDKYRDQVSSAGQSVIRLAAETVAVYFLFPSNVSSVRKLELINEILGWGGEKLPDTSIVARALSKGIGSGGKGYNNYRYAELAFLIDFAIKWKGLSESEQGDALSDPWKYETFTDSVDGAGKRQLRHVLLHLLFPDQFERIATGYHKRLIIHAFQGLLATSVDDEDQQLYAIRNELERLLPDTPLDFYWKPLEQAWDPASDGSGDSAPLELIQHKKQIMLYGPPGTGKTFRAKRLAERIIHAAALKKWGAAGYFQKQDDIENAFKTNIRRLQLHPAYSYEDFIRALHLTENGGTEYRPGYLLKLISEMGNQDHAHRLPFVLILDETNRTDLSRMLGECFSLLEDRNEELDLPSQYRDGTGMKIRIPDDLYIIGTMNLIDQSIEQIDFALRRRFLWLSCPFDAEVLFQVTKEKWEIEIPQIEWERVANEFRELADRATELNREIEASMLLGKQYEIGHTYFFDVVHFAKLEFGTQSKRKRPLLWRQGGAERPVMQAWNHSLRPLLHEYLAGLDSTAREGELKRLEAVFLHRRSPQE